MIYLTGQHDRQDERLTRQIPNQSRNWLLTVRYFEPCTNTPNTTSHNFDEKCVGSLRSHRIYNMCKGCEKGPTLMLRVLTRILYTGVHRTNRKAKRGS